MTPAIRSLESSGVSYRILRYEVEAVSNIGQAAAAALNLDPASVFKTLVVEFDQQHPAVAIIPVSDSLNLKALGRIAKAKTVALASVQKAERLTGYVTGGISPFGLKRPLPTYIAEQALSFDLIYVSAGRRGLELEVSPHDLIRCCTATPANLTQ